MTGIDPTTHWTGAHLGLPAEVSAPPIHQTPPKVLPQHDVWDMWPVQEQDGTTVVVLGSELWMALSSPVAGHPEDRHDRARIRLLAKHDDRWEDLGDVFADGMSPGSREWSGSAIRRPDGLISIFYTAAGDRGESRPTFRQRVVEVRAALSVEDGAIRLTRDNAHRVVLESDGDIYLAADETCGVPGRIKAFRDPSWFRDPADGTEHLLVAASTRWREGFSGAIAIARAGLGGWSLLPPLVVADGINHELERPHVVVHDNRYYLFFCTSRHVFHPAGRAPTGLYGFSAPSLHGPYEPLNGSGLVVANPQDRPDQAYAWLVLPDLTVVSFANYLSTGPADLRQASAPEARAKFAGTAAPVLTLSLNGNRATVVAAPCPDASVEQLRDVHQVVA